MTNLGQGLLGLMRIKLHVGHHAEVTLDLVHQISRCASGGVLGVNRVAAEERRYTSRHEMHGRPARPEGLEPHPSGP
jgi:hypothetical protein